MRRTSPSGTRSHPTFPSSAGAITSSSLAQVPPIALAPTPILPLVGFKSSRRTCAGGARACDCRARQAALHQYQPLRPNLAKPDGKPDLGADEWYLPYDKLVYLLLVVSTSR